MPMASSALLYRCASSSSPSACVGISSLHQRSRSFCQQGCVSSAVESTGWTVGVHSRFRAWRGVRAAASETTGTKWTSWVEFPRLSSAGKQLMVTVAGMMDKDLGELIKPSESASDVKSFKGGNGKGSVTLRGGQDSPKIDFCVGVMAELYATLRVPKHSNSDSHAGARGRLPHLLFEFIQSGPGSLVLVLDLLPRKDLVLNPEYLARYYEATELESLRQTFEKHPQTQPYLTCALYVRSVTSLTALVYNVSGEGVEGVLDAVITDLVQPAALKVFQTWVECWSISTGTLQICLFSSPSIKRELHIMHNILDQL